MNHRTIEQKAYDMRHPLNFLAILLLFSASSLAQEYTVSGTVVDSAKGTGLSNANVVLIRLPDSTMKGSVTDEVGKFTVKDLTRGRYILRVTYIGYKTHTRRLQITDKSLSLGKIALREDEVRLNPVDIEGQLPVAVVKGDTTEMRASAYKVNPDATAEDLVTKMPGVVKQDGQVQAQGETVKEVQVDGKRFFSGDPTAALRNIPAEVIDRIQIFDQQSEQSRFTGFDDGNTSKTINIITRGGIRYGQFGKITAGYGTDDEYNPGEYKVGGGLNLFNGDQRLTILGMTNNVNEQNFAIEDIVGAMGGGRPPGGGGGGVFRTLANIAGGSGIAGRILGAPGRGGFGGGLSDFMVMPSGGMTTTHALGLNYADKWFEKVDVQGSYFFNYTDNSAENDLFRRYVLSSTTDQTYDQREISSSNNVNHRLNLRLDWEIDTMNSILFRPRVTAQLNDGSSDLFGRTLSASVPTNSTSTLRNTTLNGINASSEILYRHRFEKQGRTFSISVQPGYNNTTGDASLRSAYRTFGTDSTLESYDQQADLRKDGWSLAGEVGYTEPLADRILLQFRYNGSRNWDESYKHTYNRSPLGSYDLLDTALSNTYENSYLSQSMGADFQYRTDSINATVGVSYQWSTLEGTQVFPYASDISHSFRNVLPNARFRWRITREKDLMGFYRARTNPPSISQLQDVIDNSNPLQLSTGNPALKQDYQHFLMLRFHSADFMRGTYFFLTFSGSYTFNSIQTSTYYAERDTLIAGIPLVRGAQLTRPENIDGAYSVRGLITYGLPVSWLMSTVNVTAFANLSRSPGLINGEKNEATSPSAGLTLVLASNISPAVDFSVSSLTIYTTTKNTLRENMNTEYWTQNTSLRLNWIFWKGFFVNTEVNHQLTSGLSAGYERNVVLWNAGIGKKFLKNDAGEVRLTLYDLLNQNTNTQRTNTEFYIQDSRSNTLRRYALLTFSYTLRNISLR
ncbi:MAG: TonB-dependent receptor [Bacteroidota bacterium]|nr:TonB-dependent receptor [Bacteroidota bacterium]